MGYRGSGPWAHHGSLLERVKNFICRPFLFWFLKFTGFLPSRVKEKWCLAVRGLWGLPWGSVPTRFACSLAPGVLPLWDKALCVLQEGAHGWLVDDEAAFSGAAKLRLLRGGVELGALAGGQLVRRPEASVTQPSRSGAIAPQLALPWRPQDGIMPLLLLRSAMVLRLWLARVALLASFFLRSWVVSRLCPWPRGLPATAVELSCRYLREE